eukprot:1503963-Ditylum_brightwellii.AAC.2
MLINYRSKRAPTRWRDMDALVFVAAAGGRAKVKNITCFRCDKKGHDATEKNSAGVIRSSIFSDESHVLYKLRCKLLGE